jgi:hypothetical protein
VNAANKNRPPLNQLYNTAAASIDLADRGEGFAVRGEGSAVRREGFLAEKA